ncbi:MAG: hypothetical protein ACMUIU_13595 [bacterium]
MPNETYLFERQWPSMTQLWHFFNPSGIAIDDKGFVYVADTYNNRIQKFTPEGGFVTKWGTWGSGYTAGSDGIFARSQTIGYGFAVADDVPIIGTIMPEKYLDEDTNALIWVDDVTSTGIIDSVWGIITPPDYRPDTTVTDLPRVELLPAGGGRYEGAYNGFSEKGPYTVTVYAMDPNKNISLPKETKVYQLGNNDSSEEANVISLDQSTP